jgi:predicted RNA-binding protein associated with RNAse of E/G family
MRSHCHADEVTRGPRQSQKPKVSARNRPLVCQPRGVSATVHPPKVEVFDIAAMTNTDPKGFVRVVDEYRVEDFGLYMARPVDGHPEISYFYSWLLPRLGLRVSRWGAHHDRGFDHDFYLDVVDIETGPAWRTTDLYLDILVRTGHGQRLLDTDEALAALSAGWIDHEAAERAFLRAFHAADGIAAAGWRVEHWLADQGLPATWPRP